LAVRNTVKWPWKLALASFGGGRETGARAVRWEDNAADEGMERTGWARHL
jgi:hypothetical protein